MNKVIVCGNLTRDIEVRYTTSGTAVAETGVAVNRRIKEDKEETVFVDVTFWGRQAEVVGEYLSKGRKILIEGRLSQDTWEDKETGKKRSKHFVTCENFHFVDSKKEE